MSDDHEERPTWGRPGERPGARRAEDQLADEGVVSRRPPAATTARAVATWVDQQIQQAERQGAFNDLPGAGKPLREVDTRTDPDWWVRGLIEREHLDLSEAMPGPLQLRREKSRFPQSLLDLPDETAVRAHLEDFNARVLADRRWPYAGVGSAPVVGRVDVDAMVEVWRAARAGQERPSAQAARRPEELPRPQFLTAAKRDKLPPAPDRGWWSRLVALIAGSATGAQAGIITHRHQKRPDTVPDNRRHGRRGAGGLGNGP